MAKAKKRKRVSLHLRVWDNERQEIKDKAYRRRLTVSQFALERLLPHAKRKS